MRADEEGSHGRESRPNLKQDICPELRQREQWLVARVTEVGGKRPLHPNDPTAVDEGLSFERAIQVANNPPEHIQVPDWYWGGGPTLVGFMVSPSDPYAFVDWDNVRDPGLSDESIPDLVWQFVEEVGTYTEISPSGTGVKQLVRCPDRVEELLSEYGHRQTLGLDPIGALEDEPKLEVYVDHHYTTVTGTLLKHPQTGACYDSVTDADGELGRLIEEHFSTASTSTQTSEGASDDDPGSGITSIGRRSAKRWTQTKKASSASEHTQGDFDGEWVETDEPTVEQIAATGSRLDDQFRRLWNGRWREFDSVSEADHGLVSKLWYYAGDRELVKEAFEESRLYGIRLRKPWISPWSKDYPKWEEDSYRRNTLMKTADNGKDPHSGRYLQP